jgi:GNAT superfamily N-acetyltransferase
VTRSGSTRQMPVEVTPIGRDHDQRIGRAQATRLTFVDPASSFGGPDIEWRVAVGDDELVRLTRSHGGRAVAGWWDQVRPHSLGWVTARLADGELVGFANVAWDGSDHAFLLDVKTSPDYQRLGIATAVVKAAVEHTRLAGCEWLHVDFEDHLVGFYFDSCGFRSTRAGLINLWEPNVGWVKNGGSGLDQLT